MKIEKYGNRNWAVYDNSGCLVCITVYNKGAQEVIRWLSTEATNDCNQPSGTMNNLTALLEDFKQLNRNFNQLARNIKHLQKSI